MTTSPDYITREELEAALLSMKAEFETAVFQVHSEIADDRKRLTTMEQFSNDLYHVLWSRFKGVRMEFDEKLRKYLSYLSLGE